MKNWYIKYFNLHPQGVCRQCGEPCEGVFCDIKCSVLFEKDNNLKEIGELRTKLIQYQRRLDKVKPSYKDKLLCECDKLALQLKNMTDKVIIK